MTRLSPGHKPADDSLYDFDVICAANSRRMPDVVVKPQDHEVTCGLPAHPIKGTTLRELEAIGLSIVDWRSEHYAIFSLPPRWSVYTSGLNRYQQRLYDDLGRPRARLHNRPDMQGGDIELLPLDGQEANLPAELTPWLSTQD